MNATVDKQHQIFTLIGIGLAMFLGALDQTIVSTATPKIIDELHGIDRVTWITTIYLLISTVMVPIFGKLADIVSRKTLEVWSIGIFLLGSMLCGLAGEWGPLPVLGDGMSQLIFFRGIQGLGGAGLFSLAFIIIADLYPPRERGRISGLFGAVFGLSSVVGPLAGGFLTDYAGAWISGIEGWRWVFYVNVPIAIIALLVIILRMPRLQPADNDHQVDFVSAALIVLAFAPLVLGLSLDKNAYPWTSPLVLGLVISGLVFMAIWIWHSLKVSKHPVLDLRLFTDKVFYTTCIASFFFGAAFFSIILFLPLYMVFVQGRTIAEAGISIIPVTVGIIIGTALSGGISSRLGRYKLLMVIGTVITLIGVFMIWLCGVGTSMVFITIAMVVTGIGFGPGMALYPLAVQNNAAPTKIGQVTSAAQFARQIGGTVGAAVLGTVFSAVFAASMSGALPGYAGASGGADRSKGLSEVRTEVEKGFDDATARVQQLLALRGEAIPAALAALERDPNVPGELKAKLAEGTPAQTIEKGMVNLSSRLEELIPAGDLAGLERLLADASPTSVAANLPAAVKAGLLRLAAAPPAARRQALPGVLSQLQSQSPAIVDAASAKASAAITESLQKVKKDVADKVVGAITQSFADGTHRVWLFSLFIVICYILGTLLIPSLPLRSRDGPPPAAAA